MIVVPAPMESWSRPNGPIVLDVCKSLFDTEEVIHTP
jgi:hypothetical protein